MPWEAAENAVVLKERTNIWPEGVIGVRSVRMAKRREPPPHQGLVERQPPPALGDRRIRSTIDPGGPLPRAGCSSAARMPRPCPRDMQHANPACAPNAVGLCPREHAGEGARGKVTPPPLRVDKIFISTLRGAGDAMAEFL